MVSGEGPGSPPWVLTISGRAHIGGWGVRPTRKSISVSVRVVRTVRVVRAGGRGEAAWACECGDFLP